ncbi:MFS transporter [Glycocaulis albus]|jgi:sugar phosphate permease|uniref:MFS transporter n=1 Tax=Glycocaulis albus TaxID=1382801 RepID=A0ABQ1XF83_9PROT|nr:MFS transporter [Glycocaulis albus]GGG91835.1 MFS transporter [Glycocaulis albus]
MLDFIRTNARWLSAGLLLTFVSSFGQTFFIGLSGNDMRARFGLSEGEFGLIYMLATLASAAILPWLGRSLDHADAWKVAGFSLPALAAACLLVAFAPHVAVLALAIWLLRLFGQGMMTHIALTQTGRWFAANRGRAVSLVVPGHQLGEALLPVVFVSAAALLGWQGAWIASAALIALIAWPLAVALLRRERVPQGDDIAASAGDRQRQWTRGEVLRDPVFYLLLTGVLAPPFIGTTIFFHQGHFIGLRGYDPLVFASAFPLMAVTTIIFGFVCGALIDRFGTVRILPFFLVPLAIASLSAGLLTPVWGVYLFMFLVGVSYGFTATLLGALWPDVYGVTHLGGIRAIIVSAMVFSTALGPGLTGVLIDQGIDLPDQLIFMAGWCVLASLCLWFAARTLRRRQGGPE